MVGLDLRFARWVCPVCPSTKIVSRCVARNLAYVQLPLSRLVLSLKTFRESWINSWLTLFLSWLNFSIVTRNLNDVGALPNLHGPKPNSHKRIYCRDWFFVAYPKLHSQNLILETLSRLLENENAWTTVTIVFSSTMSFTTAIFATSYESINLSDLDSRNPSWRPLMSFHWIQPSKIPLSSSVAACP